MGESPACWQFISLWGGSGHRTMLAQSDATMMNLTACSLTRFHEDSLLFLAGFVLACAGRRWRLAFH
jgi:hypothetical protein